MAHKYIQGYPKFNSGEQNICMRQDGSRKGLIFAGYVQVPQASDGTELPGFCCTVAVSALVQQPGSEPNKKKTAIV
jgi:hypothetical protein